MGLSFSSLKSWMTLLVAKKDVRILMVGLDAAGKTTILYKLKLGDNVMTIPTIGFNVETVEYKNICLTMWDIGGQDRIRNLWRYYYTNTQVVIFVVDSSDRDRLALVREEIHKLMNEPELQSASLLVYANKQDLPGAAPISHMSQELDLHKLHGRKWYIQGCSAVTGDGLYEGLDWVSSNID